MSEAAPRLPVLSYGGATFTRTRARKAAIIGAFSAAGVYVLLAVLTTYWTLTEVRDVLDEGSYGFAYGRGPAPTSLLEWVAVYARAAAICPGAYLGVVVLAALTLAFIAAAGVVRGVRWACAAAAVLQVPMILLSSCIAAFLIAAPPYWLATAKYGDRPVGLWLAGIGLPLVGLLAALAAMLIFDLIACLGWVRRSIPEEMPKRKFLS